MKCVTLGIKDSKLYLSESLKYLDKKITHISISIECKTPKISPKISEMRTSISHLLGVSEDSVGITATSGEELTEVRYGKRN